MDATLFCPTFEDHLKIAAFREITSQLLDNGLITHGEAAKINHRISKMDTDMIRGKASATHIRELKSA